MRTLGRPASGIICNSMHVRVPVDIYNKLKVAAAMANLTMSDIVVSKIKEYVGSAGTLDPVGIRELQIESHWTSFHDYWETHQPQDCMEMFDWYSIEASHLKGNIFDIDREIMTNGKERHRKYCLRKMGKL